MEESKFLKKFVLILERKIVSMYDEDIDYYTKLEEKARLDLNHSTVQKRNLWKDKKLITSRQIRYKFKRKFRASQIALKTSSTKKRRKDNAPEQDPPVAEEEEAEVEEEAGKEDEAQDPSPTPATEEVVEETELSEDIIDVAEAQNPPPLPPPPPPPITTVAKEAEVIPLDASPIVLDDEDSEEIYSDHSESDDPYLSEYEEEEEEMRVETGKAREELTREVEDLVDATTRTDDDDQEEEEGDAEIDTDGNNIGSIMPGSVVGLGIKKMDALFLKHEVKPAFNLYKRPGSSECFYTSLTSSDIVTKETVYNYARNRMTKEGRRNFFGALYSQVNAYTSREAAWEALCVFLRERNWPIPSAPSVFDYDPRT